jgi:hypothetical protein
MNKKIKIVSSPFNPPLEVIDKIVVKLHVPYSDQSVTIQVCPNVQEYIENADTKAAAIRQVTITTPTDQTTTLSFDIEKNRTKSVAAEGTEYEIELLNIGKEEVQGQQFRSFEFNVSWG